MTAGPVDVTEPVDPLLFRRTMGRFPTGVTVVTTRDREGRPWGMTANSFTSVSLSPPLISVCISNRAGSFRAFSECETFGVSILAEHQKDAAVRFATPVDDKFAGLLQTEAQPGAIILPDASATFTCTVHTRIEAGDHTILVGAVTSCVANSHPPLGYCDGSFFTMDAEESLGKAEPGRRILVGWLVEHDTKILLSRDEKSGEWSLPMGPLRPGVTMAEALIKTSVKIIGQRIDPEFLYSTIDLNDLDSCYVYRARPADLPRETGQQRLFAEEEIPWDELAHSQMETTLRRYFRERVSDRFGIFVNVGSGRLATIEHEAPWEATAADA